MKQFRVGLKRRWIAGLGDAFGAVGVVWSITEISKFALSSIEQVVSTHRHLYLIVILCIAALAFLRRIREVRSVSFRVPTTHSTISIFFGDLFEQKTNWLIGVNEFFDSELGHVVSQGSLHGKFITQIFNGDCRRFRNFVDAALQNEVYEKVPREGNLPVARYEIGTTATVPIGEHTAFLVAMAHTDTRTAKALSSVPILWKAIADALTTIKDQGNGLPLSMPLLGNGRSSVNIEPQHLLRLITLALVDFSRKQEIPKQVNIVLHEACFDSLDIREIRRDWRAPNGLS